MVKTYKSDLINFSNPVQREILLLGGDTFAQRLGIYPLVISFTCTADLHEVNVNLKIENSHKEIYEILIRKLCLVVMSHVSNEETRHFNT